MKNQYQETLDYLFSQLPMYQRVGDSAMKKNLDNILALCEALGNPQNKFKSIHIAGTNGKGSVTHILAAVLKQAGYKVACYTSPHYLDFRERIKILSTKENITLIPEQNVIDFVAENKAILESIKPSFFEMTVAMAFDCFAKEKVDIAIIETGLGGRLDSTNIITPLLSIITNISKDHTQFLGETLPEIAFEKAGIIKKNTPIIIGKKQKETTAVFKQKAKETESNLMFAKDILNIKDFKTKMGKKSSFTTNFKGRKIDFKTDLFGDFQKENLRTALSSLIYLKKKKRINFETKDLEKALKNIQTETYFLGRNTIISKSPLTIADSAHNVAGISTLVKQINELKYNKLHFVYGTVSDKDVATIFTLLPKDAQYYFCKPNIIRGMEAEKLKTFGDQFLFNYNTYSSVKEALKVAQNSAKTNDLIIVSGSIFVVAEVL